MVSQSDFHNHLIARMNADDFTRLAPHLSAKQFSLRDGIEEANKPITTICFPESGIISMLAVGRHGRSIEAGMIGFEGMSGLPVVMGADRSPQRSLIQIEGMGHCVSAEHLRAAMETNPGLRLYLLLYAQRFFNQVANTALSNGMDTLEQRLARWVLISLDRIEGMRLSLTHEFLAQMLAVRRPGVTSALHELEGRGLIRNERGTLLVIDREGLQDYAGEAYIGSDI